MPEDIEVEDKLNLLDEEATLKIYANRLGIPSLVQSNKMYLMLVGFTKEDIYKAVKENYTSLNWMLDLKNSVIYLDYGLNRQKLTRSLLNKLSEVDTA